MNKVIARDEWYDGLAEFKEDFDEARILISKLARDKVTILIH